MISPHLLTKALRTLLVAYDRWTRAHPGWPWVSPHRVLLGLELALAVVTLVLLLLKLVEDFQRGDLDLLPFLLWLLSTRLCVLG